MKRLSCRGVLSRRISARLIEVYLPGVLLPMLRHIAIACTLLTMVSSVSAHEGHGHPEHPNGILHYVVNPSHAIPGVLVCIVALSAAFFIRKVRKARADKHE